MAEGDSSKRQVAYKVRIADLLNNRYVKEDGWLPNYIAVGDMKVSRANLMGVIVSKASQEGGNDSAAHDFILDDGSGRVSLRFFESAGAIDVGDIVMVIGRPREFGTERYVVPEVVRKVTDPKWVELRKLELAKTKHDSAPQPSPQSSETGSVEMTGGYETSDGELDLETDDLSDENPMSKIVNIIKELDDGSGAEFDLVAAKFDGDAEQSVKKLLEQGDIFEVKPGRYKVLE